MIDVNELSTESIQVEIHRLEAGLERRGSTRNHILGMLAKRIGGEFEAPWQKHLRDIDELIRRDRIQVECMRIALRAMEQLEAEGSPTLF